MGPDATESIVGLFRDREFPANLRNLAADAAVKSSGRKHELLEEYVKHLEDPKEDMVVKTGLVYIFKEHPYEGAVDLLISGARTRGYPEQHRTVCLQALERYDHPRVIKALAEEWDMAASFDDQQAVTRTQAAISDVLEKLAETAEKRFYDVLILDEIVFCLSHGLASLADIKV